MLAILSFPLLNANAGNDIEINVAKSVCLDGDSRGTKVSKISRLRL